MALLEEIQDVNAELNRLSLQVDGLLFEKTALLKQRDSLVESNKKLKEECENLRQLHFREYKTDWIKEYHDLFEQYQKLERETIRLEQKNEYLFNRVKELEEQTTPRTRQTVCEECGVKFQEKVKGRKARFCSARCRKRHQRTEDLFRKAKAHTKQTLTEIIL